MKKFENQKGITLVALVVTIIVLLILAGVSLSLVVGSNGIIDKASGAASATTEESLKELTAMALFPIQAELIDPTSANYGKGYDYIKDTEEGSDMAKAIASLVASDITVDLATDGKTITVAKDGIELTADISEKGSLTWQTETNNTPTEE